MVPYGQALHEETGEKKETCGQVTRSVRDRRERRLWTPARTKIVRIYTSISATDQLLLLRGVRSLPDETIFSTVGEDCFTPTGFAMTKGVMTKWRDSEPGEGRLRVIEIIYLEENGFNQWTGVFQCHQTTED